MPTFQKVKNHWEYKTLSQLGFVGRGKSKHRPRNASILYGGKYPFIQTSDIKHANFYVNSYSQTYNEVGLKQSKLWEKDTLCMTIAANIAETALLSFPACFPDSVVGFVADREKSNVKFVKYALDFAKKSFQTVAEGTAQDNLSLEKIDNLKINVPDIKTQEGIAGVLGAYDDLIENNEKRIKALEQMAQLLYTEWFASPSVARSNSGDAKEGKLPSGWEIKNLGEVTSVITKGTTPTTLNKNFVKNGINFIKIESIGNNGEIFENKLAKIDQETHDLLSRSKLQNGDVLFSIAGAIGRTVRIISRFLPANTNQALAIIRPKEEIYRIYLYQVISSLNFLNFSKGRIVQTAQANVSLTVLASAKILFPNRKILIAYNEKISPIFEMIDKIRNQNRILEKTRDLLIPQLVTGKRELK